LNRLMSFVACLCKTGPHASHLMSFLCKLTHVCLTRNQSRGTGSELSPVSRARIARVISLVELDPRSDLDPDADTRPRSTDDVEEEDTEPTTDPGVPPRS
jgi:hypothetical protein